MPHAAENACIHQRVSHRPRRLPVAFLRRRNLPVPALSFEEQPHCLAEVTSGLDQSICFKRGMRLEERRAGIALDWRLTSIENSDARAA